MSIIRLGFIGTGNIASMLFSGVLKNNLISPEFVHAFDPEASKLESFKNSGAAAESSGESVVAACDIIVLAVKPQIFPVVLAGIRGAGKHKCVVSPAAGISTRYIASHLEGDGHEIIRVMPNTPMAVGNGATAIALPENGEKTPAYDFVLRMFECCGVVCELPEEKMNEIIAVNGSSPALFYRIIGDMTQYAESCGIEKGAALRLACESMIGSAKMLLETGKSPSELISNVASPGGTTLAMLHSLDDQKFDDVLIKALKACTARAEELAKS